MNASTPFGADMKQLAEYTKLLTHNLIFENLFLPWATYWQTGFLKPWYVIPLRTKSWHPNSSKESFWSIYLALSRNGGRPKYKKLSTLCGNWSQAQLLIIYNWQLRSSNARSALNQCITPKCSIMNAASNPPTNVVIWFLLVMTIDPVTFHCSTKRTVREGSGTNALELHSCYGWNQSWVKKCWWGHGCWVNININPQETLNHQSTHLHEDFRWFTIFPIVHDLWQ